MDTATNHTFAQLAVIACFLTALAAFGSGHGAHTGDPYNVSLSCTQCDACSCPVPYAEERVYVTHIACDDIATGRLITAAAFPMYCNHERPVRHVDPLIVQEPESVPDRATQLPHYYPMRDHTREALRRRAEHQLGPCYTVQIGTDAYNAWWRLNVTWKDAWTCAPGATGAVHIREQPIQFLQHTLQRLW